MKAAAALTGEYLTGGNGAYAGNRNQPEHM
jgi:hypothetical protein